MKVAIQISGQTRGKEEAFPSLKKNILDVLDCDIYIQTCEDSSSEGLTNLLSSLDIKPIYLDIRKDFFIKKNCIRPITAPKTDDSIQRYFQQLYGLMLVNEARNNSGIRYDWVIRTRSDLRYTNLIPDLSKLDSRKMYVPLRDDCLGMNDRFAISCLENMDYYCDTFNWIDTLDRPFFNPETLLKHRMRIKGIEVEKMNIDIHRCGKSEAKGAKVKWQNIIGKGNMYV